MIILNRNSSETARSYAMRVLLYNIIHVELQPGSAVSENELSSAGWFSREDIPEDDGFSLTGEMMGLFIKVGANFNV